MKTFWIVVIVVVALAATVFAAVFLRDPTPPSIQSTSGGASGAAGENIFGRISGFEFKDYSGNIVSLAEFEGKPLVVNSWAVWCPFCRQELPDFARLQQELGDEIVVIAIDRQEPLARAKEYTDGLGISSDMHFWLDDADVFYRTIGGFSMPETLFINVAGEIVVHKRGPMDLEEMKEHAGKILSAGVSVL